MLNAAVLRRAKDLIDSQEYVQNWFGADAFFNTEYMSDIYTGDYFITCDQFMSSKIWAVRKISSNGIETIYSGQTSEQDALEAMKEDRA